MKIASYQVMTLAVPEDDPLANMPEDANRKRPISCACAPTAASRASPSRSMAGP